MIRVKNKSLLTMASLGLLCSMLLAGTPVPSQAQTPSPPAGGRPLPFLAQVEKKNVNIRAGQNINFERIGRLKKGAKVVVVEQSYSWYQIKLPVGADSYISTDFIQMLGPDIGAVMGNRVNIRARTGINSSVVGQLNKGTLVRILKTYPSGHASEGWCKIEPADQSYGWVLAKYVTFNSKKIPAPRTVRYVKPKPPAYKKSGKDIEEEKRLIIAKIKERAFKTAAARAKKAALEKAAREKAAREKAAREKATRVSGTGFIKALGRKALSKDIRHKLVVDGKTVYFLKGYRRIIDGFLNHKVTIEGKRQPDIRAPHPVVLVTKINLVL